ncbi:MAG TPA: extracellular solute-binding protein [Rhodothermia bacterium]|nr:extracellular solute-binding protein [Rhodothermia bacterium]
MQNRPSGIRIVWLVALVAAFSIGCGDQAKRARVVVYTPHGKELLRAYEDAFERDHPEVDVQWIDMGTQQVFDRVNTESARPQGSVWWGGPASVFDQAARLGLLEAYEPTWSEHIVASARHPQHFWYGTYVTPEVITFNNRIVPQEDAPKDWDDILLPEWKDRVLIRYPLASGTMRTIFGAMIMRQPTVEDGYIWLARLDVNTKSYAADPTQLYLKLAREEGAVTLWNMPDTDLQIRDNGYPFSYHVPASGTPLLTEGIALIKGGPHREHAVAFYEFVTSREALVRQANDFHRIPARIDLDPDHLPEWIRNVEVRSMEVDWERLATEGPGWMQYWDEHIKGRGEVYLKERGLTP